MVRTTPPASAGAVHRLEASAAVRGKGSAQRFRQALEGLLAAAPAP